jgi:O-antigen ligase
LSTDWFGWELVPATVLALYLGISARSGRERFLGLTLFAASLLGIVYSFARASLIAVFAALLLAGLLRRVHPAVYVVTIGVAVLGLVVFLPSTAKSRLVGVTAPVTGSVASASDASVRNRAGENLAALHMFLDYPYLGVGPGNYPVLYTKYSETVGLDPRNEARPPHNLYLEALAETGVVGTLLLLALIGRALRGAWRARSALPGRDGLLCEGVFVALVGYMINGLFLHASAYSRYLWLTIGFGLVCERLARAAQVGRVGRA